MKPDKVQVPYDLFCNIFRYFFLGAGRDDYSEEAEAIRKQIHDKLTAARKRKLYSMSKDKNLTPEEREKARQEYLDLAGIKDSFRWSREYAEHLLNGNDNLN